MAVDGTEGVHLDQTFLVLIALAKLALVGVRLASDRLLKVSGHAMSSAADQGLDVNRGAALGDFLTGTDEPWVITTTFIATGVGAVILAVVAVIMYRRKK
jgi:hypothetical protein